MPKKKTYEEVKSLFESKEYILLETEYINALTKMKYICKKHPNIIQSIRYNSLQQGKGCPYCVGKAKHTFEEVKAYFESCGYTLLEDTYINSNTKMRYQCPNHPNKELYIRYSDLRHGIRCPYCSKVGRKSYEEIKEEFEARGYTLISPREEYVNSNSILKYICPSHPNNINTIIYYNFYYGEGCPHCRSSKGEKRIKEWLDKQDIYFEQQKKFDDLKDKRKLSYDFYIPEHNLLIEYQGAYHDGLVHENNPKFQTKEDLENQQKRDNLKRQYAKDNNYRLLEIWYWDYKNIESILEKELNI